MMDTIEQAVDRIAEECFRAGINVAVMEKIMSDKHGWAPQSDEDFDSIISDEASNFLFEKFVTQIELAIQQKIEARRAETEAA